MRRVGIALGLLAVGIAILVSRLRPRIDWSEPLSKLGLILALVGALSLAIQLPVAESPPSKY
jgi:hypothetical protein